MMKRNIFDYMETDTQNYDKDNFIEETGINTENVKKLFYKAAAPSAKKVRPVRRRFMYGLAAALISAATIVGTMAVVAQTNGEIVEPKETQKTEQNTIKKLDDKKIAELNKKISMEDEQAISKLMYEELGYDMKNMKSSDITPQYEIDYVFAKAKYGNIVYRDLVNKAIEMGYGDKSLMVTDEDFDYVRNENGEYTANKDFYSDETLKKYYLRTIACCKAYNDPEFHITDEDRLRMINMFNKDYQNIYQAVNESEKYNDTMIKAYELIEKTIVPESGYRELPLDNATKEES